MAIGQVARMIAAIARLEDGEPDVAELATGAQFARPVGAIRATILARSPYSPPIWPDGQIGMSHAYSPARRSILPRRAR